MDGIERVKSSIRLRLSFWLSVAMLVVALLAGAVSFRSAFGEAHELQDDTLRQVAALCAESPRAFIPVGERLFQRGRESKVIALALPATDPRFPVLHDGLHTLNLEGTDYRVCLRSLTSDLRIVVAQATEVRDEAAQDSVERTLLPMLILIPLLLILVSYLVKRMFRPLTRMADEVDGRGEQDLRPLATTGLPMEVSPFAVAINRLLERVSQSMLAQRRFIADAAHELRSPLTALSLQAERLAEAEMSEEASQRLERLRAGIERGRSLLNQLLDLARAQAVSAEAPLGPVDLARVCRRVVEDCMPLAEARRIDLGSPRMDAVELLASEVDLQVLIKNLLDNAIRYTPLGGTVDLSLEARDNGAVLTLEDSGPGIPESERERVLDAFYRVQGSEESGSGLGLAIVQTILKRMGGQLELSDATRFPSGLKVTIRLPKP